MVVLKREEDLTDGLFRQRNKNKYLTIKTTERMTHLKMRTINLYFALIVSR